MGKTKEEKTKKKCEICEKDTNELFYIYNSYCPHLSYKCCRECMEKQRIPYWGIVGLLAMPEQWGYTLTSEQRNEINENAQKEFHKTHSQIEEDISKAKKIALDIMNNNKGVENK